MLGAALIRGMLGEAPRFDRVRDVSVYLIAAVVIAPVLTSFLDAALVALVGWRYDGDYWAVVRMRLPSNVLAAIIVPPFMIIALRDAPALLRSVSRARWVEGAALLAVLCAVSLAVFHGTRSADEAALFVYAPLPLLIWATLTNRCRWSHYRVLRSWRSCPLPGLCRAQGPSPLAGPDRAVLSLQIFLIVTASTLMLLAAALAELHEARAVALRREARLDLALRAAHMGAWEWDMLSDRISWRLAAHSGEIVLQSTDSVDELLERVHRNDRHRLLAAMRAAREEGGAGEVECRFNCDGRLRWIRGLGKVQREADGQSLAMIGVCIDTTQHKTVEIEQRSQREKLAHLARSATLGELSGALAHEISQPLAAILLNARAAQQEVLKARPDIQELRAIIDDIAADDQRASETIGRLRALFPRDPVQMEQVQIEECIRSILALEHSDLLARNVTVDLHIDERAPASDSRAGTTAAGAAQPDRQRLRSHGRAEHGSTVAHRGPAPRRRGPRGSERHRLGRRRLREYFPAVVLDPPAQGRARPGDRTHHRLRARRPAVGCEQPGRRRYVLHRSAGGSRGLKLRPAPPA